MGANVNFIAFRKEPDVEKLAAIPGLNGFRLFKHNAKQEWYLEGPNPEGDAITFHERLDYAPKGEAFKQAQAATKKLADAFRKAEVKPYGLDNKALAAALAIGNELGLPTLLIYSNDDGVDAGFICEGGQVSHAKLPNLPTAMVVFENGAVRLKAPESEEYDEGEPVLDLHQFATEVANTFFGESVRWRVTSDSSEFKASDYTLVSGRGERAPLKLPGDDIKTELWAIETSSANGRQKLQKSIAIIDAHVAAALQERLITSERAERDLVEWSVSACLLHASSHRQPPSASFERINVYLLKVLNYLRLLRPKPDFRRSMDFPAEARKLRGEWRMLKLKLLFASV
ncbi:MAG: hypothetical protein ABL996_00650 [Micropepsaceae bacterium]